MSTDTDFQIVETPDVYDLYTPAMLADLLGIPVQAVRRWYRLGYLKSRRHVKRLPYFDFAEVSVARHLAKMLNSGCSLAGIDRKLNELRQALPDVERPLTDPSVVVTGGQVAARRGAELSEPAGQLLIDFDSLNDQQDSKDSHFVVEFNIAANQTEISSSQSTLSTSNQLLFEALKWEDRGELGRAAEVYRTLLMAGQPTAEIHFALGDLLYRMSDLSAARERFYAAIEIDEEYVEARASLGCVLGESGELELAVASFQGALAIDSEYADVHYHLANALDCLGRSDESELHWRTFLALAPESVWAETVRQRLEPSEESCEVVLTT